MSLSLVTTTVRNEITRTVPMDRHPAVVYISRLAPGSRRTMSQALDTIARIISNGERDAETLSWASLRYQHTTAVRTVLMERYAPATANKMLAALRGVLKECWRLGLTRADDFRRAADLLAVRGQTLPRGRALSAGELRALFIRCAHDPTPAGRRDAAMIALLYGGGLRRSEAVALDLSDYVSETGELRIRQGKGRKNRLVYLQNGAAKALRAWVQTRGMEPGPMFFGVNKGGRILPRRLTPQVIRWMLLKRAAEADVLTFSPHDLRRTFISDILDHGCDLSTAQGLAGHANIQTTARYDRRGEVSKQRAAALLFIPFVEAKEA